MAKTDGGTRTRNADRPSNGKKWSKKTGNTPKRGPLNQAQTEKKEGLALRAKGRYEVRAHRGQVGVNDQERQMTWDLFSAIMGSGGFVRYEEMRARRGR